MSLVALLIGCGADDIEIELTAFEELEWPEMAPLPVCTPWQGGGASAYTMPDLAPPGGLLQMDLSSVLIPTGAVERVVVKVLTDDSTLDTSASGALLVAPLAGMEVLSAGAVQAGRAEILLRFDEPGTYALSIDLENDGREGHVEVASYAPRVPIWRVQVDADALAEMSANSSERFTIAAELEVDGVVHPATLRLHGGSSRNFPKKSFRFNLEDEGLAGGEKHIILRAEYNDKSMLRTFLGYELFRNGTSVPTPDTEFVHLRVNQRYFGLMQHVERIDSRFLARRSLNPDGNLYESDPLSEGSASVGNLTILPSAVDYYRTYPWHAGAGAWQDLIAFIESTLRLPARAFDLVIADEVQLDSYLSYLAMMAVLQNHEHIRKNFYMYRDPEGDGRWLVLPWDLDLALGHLWSEANGVLDEQLVFDADIFVGEFVPERFGHFNQLADRVFGRPVLRERFLEILAHMLEHSFTDAFLESRLDYALCLLEPDILADTTKRADNEEYLERVDELRTFWQGRRAFISMVLRQHGVASAP